MLRQGRTTCRRDDLVRAARLRRRSGWRSAELLAVPVVEVLDPTHDAYAAPIDLVRARVVRDVVGLTCPPREDREHRVTGAECVCDTCSRRTGDDAAAAYRGRVDSVGAIELEGAFALEHDEDLFFPRMTVRNGGQRSGRRLDVFQPGPTRADRRAEVAAAPLIVHARFDVVDVDDRRGALCFRFVPLDRRLAVPRMRIDIDLHRARNEPGKAGARPRRGRRVLASPECDDVESRVTCTQRMCLVEVLVDDAVALANLVRLPVQPRDTAPCEDVEDLFRFAVDVRGRRLLAWGHLNPRNTRAIAARRDTEIRPQRDDVAALTTDRLDVVPVRNPHATTLRHGLRQRGVATVDRGTCTLIAFEPRPPLSIVDTRRRSRCRDSGAVGFARGSVYG